MVGISEEDPGVQIPEVPLAEGLDGPLRTHRHEDGGRHLPVGRLEPSGAGARDRVAAVQFEAKVVGGQWSVIRGPKWVSVIRKNIPNDL